jgi:hypothetical protein
LGCGVGLCKDRQNRKIQLRAFMVEFDVTIRMTEEKVFEYNGKGISVPVVSLLSSKNPSVLI